MTVLIRDIVALVASEWGLKPEDLIAQNRSRKYSEPRQVAMLIACRLGHSHSAIGRAMNRNHATVRKNCITAEARIERGRRISRAVENVVRDVLERV